MNTIYDLIALRFVSKLTTSVAVGTEKQLVEFFIKNQSKFDYFEKCVFVPSNKSEVFTKVIVAVDQYTDESTLVYNIQNDCYNGSLDALQEMYQDIPNAIFEICDVIYLSDNE